MTPLTKTQRAVLEKMRGGEKIVVGLLSAWFLASSEEVDLIVFKNLRDQKFIDLSGSDYTAFYTITPLGVEAIGKGEG